MAAETTAIVWPSTVTAEAAPRGPIRLLVVLPILVSKVERALLLAIVIGSSRFFTE